MYLHFQTNRLVAYLKKRFPHLEQLQESRGAAPVVVVLITSLATSRIKQYLTLKNPYFSYVTVKKCEYLFVCLYQTLFNITINPLNLIPLC